MNAATARRELSRLQARCERLDEDNLRLSAELRAERELNHRLRVAMRLHVLELLTLAQTTEEAG